VFTAKLVDFQVKIYSVVLAPTLSVLLRIDQG